MTVYSHIGFYLRLLNLPVSLSAMAPSMRQQAAGGQPPSLFVPCASCVVVG